MPRTVRFHNIREHREYRIVERPVFNDSGVLIRTDVLAYVGGVWESLEGLTIQRDKELLLSGTTRTRAVQLFVDLIALWKAEDGVTA